jgi:hypothetical protein
MLNAWNMDEIGIALGVYVNQDVVGSSSTTKSYKKSPENREWVSIIETASAVGSRTRWSSSRGSQCKALGSSMARSLIRCIPLLRMGGHPMTLA